jgi:hypothetical protein
MATKPPEFIMINIVVFEDDVTTHAEAICTQVPLPTAIPAYGSVDKLDWHKNWNALGDYSKRLNKLCGKITTDSAFEEALIWCMTTTERAIVFCDYQLKGVTVTEKQVEAVGKAALAVSGEKTVDAAERFFNREAQGLLLAAAMTANRKADVDIWLTTAVGDAVTDHRTRLKQWERTGLNIDIADGKFVKVPREAKARAIGVVKRAVTEYSNRRALIDPGFWPDHAGEWFSDSKKSEVAPHQHGALVALLAKGKGGEVVNYLKGLGASDTTAKKWLHQKGCHDALVHFLGGCARAHNAHEKDRSLTLGSLLFPLLMATPDSDWADLLKWESAVVSILEADRTASRRMILSALELFKRLFAPRNAGQAPHKVRAQFLAKKDGLHLMVDFDFDCSIGELPQAATRYKPPLLTKALLLPWCSPKGDVTVALAGFLASTVQPDNNHTLFTSVYPISHEKDTWTRLDFKANT